MDIAEREAEAHDASRRSLSRHPRRSVREWFEFLAGSEFADGPADFYGTGALVESLETRVAELLGAEAALFVMKGVIAQQAALRVWTDSSGVPTVALHPRSHIDLDESGGYERLHGMVPIRIPAIGPFTVARLRTVTERIGVVTVELPLRRDAFRLLPWEELEAVSAWCRENGVPLHFDGARLWEAAPYYGRSLAEIAALADSVYVSFYKGLGGLAGCVLAGSADFVAAARSWAGRQGSNLHAAFPYTVAALEGLRHHLPRMEEYHLRAVSLAAALGGLPGVFVAPETPHTNAFHIYLPGTPARLREANVAIAESESVWLFDVFGPCPIPGLTLAEVQVGDSTAELTDEEAAALVGRLVTMAAG